MPTSRHYFTAHPHQPRTTHMRMILAAVALAAIPSVALAQSGDVACTLADATYALVEQKNASPDARLTFSPSETMTGVGGSMTLAAGDVPFVVGVRNGDAALFAEFDLGNGKTSSAHVQAFTSDMANAPLGMEEAAPAFVVFPLAVIDAYRQQEDRPAAERLLPPEMAWHLIGCSS